MSHEYIRCPACAVKVPDDLFCGHWLRSHSGCDDVREKILAGKRFTIEYTCVCGDKFSGFTLLAKHAASTGDFLEHYYGGVYGREES